MSNKENNQSKYFNTCVSLHISNVLMCRKQLMTIQTLFLGAVCLCRVVVPA